MTRIALLFLTFAAIGLNGCTLLLAGAAGGAAGYAVSEANEEDESENED